MKKAGSLSSVGAVVGGLVTPFLALVHKIILLGLSLADELAGAVSDVISSAAVHSVSVLLLLW